MNNDKDVKAKKTYPQVWNAYNTAQTTEKAHFTRFLYTLCNSVEDPDPQTRGRPRMPLNEALFAVCYKIYSTMSARRFMTDLRDAEAMGLISRTPHFNSIFNYLENEKLTPILYYMIEQSSAPLRSMEDAFAVDSSGFTTSKYASWIKTKYGRPKIRQWVKVHLTCGVKTNIVTAVSIGDKSANDSPFLPDLIKRTSNNFTVKEVYADGAYSSVNNVETITNMDAVPYIPFRSFAQGRHNQRIANNDAWRRMYHYFMFNNEEFKKHYHKRSNVESTFAMIKAKFGGHLRSKTPVSMVNESLCKIICHNLCVLIQEMHELNIDIDIRA
jgi:transposase